MHPAAAAGVASTLLPLFVWLAPVSARSQAQASVGNARTVLAAIVDADGRPAIDVGADDFVVSEGSEPREVLEVHVADYPVALVIDDRPQPNVPLNSLRRAALRLVGRLGERPVALLRLSDGSTPIVTLDEERGVLVDRLSSFTAASVTTTPPLDTVARAAALLKETGAPFSAVIVIASGPVDAGALVRGELLPQIQESGAAVHVVRLQQTGDGQAETNGTPAEDLLRVVADQTRGQFTSIFSPASYDAALDRLADRLAIEMMVQYVVPPGPKAGDVRVGVKRPGSRVIGLGVK